MNGGTYSTVLRRTPGKSPYIVQHDDAVLPPTALPVIYRDPACCEPASVQKSIGNGQLVWLHDMSGTPAITLSGDGSAGWNSTVEVSRCVYQCLMYLTGKEDIAIACDTVIWPIPDGRFQDHR